MNQESTECSQLIEETVSVLDDNNLQLLLVSTQQVSLEICINYAQSQCVAPSKLTLEEKEIDVQSYRSLMEKIFECSSIKGRIGWIKDGTLLMTPNNQTRILEWFPHVVVICTLKY